jgi:hypothetical protein
VESFIGKLKEVKAKFADVPSSELEYKSGAKLDGNEAIIGPIVSLVQRPLSTVNLSYVLEKPLFGEHLVVTGTVVLDPPLNMAGTAVEPLEYASILVKQVAS